MSLGVSTDLQSLVELAYAEPKRLDEPASREAVEATIAALDRGEVRLAEKSSGVLPSTMSSSPTGGGVVGVRGAAANRAATLMPPGSPWVLPGIWEWP